MSGPIQDLDVAARPHGDDAPVGNGEPFGGGVGVVDSEHGRGKDEVGGRHSGILATLLTCDLRFRAHENSGYFFSVAGVD
ncbi:hypothetical protein AWC01_14920 [Mycobacterium doricum]|uniref:Uncharacterized protein n=1 Tax=Mycolicibacterium doricum TaxID=126673 RepID=A0A1X1T0X0_9MYCO|nr:hypothetical protein AWC01_14920 [Mycolicibacterium doricum]